MSSNGNNFKADVSTPPKPRRASLPLIIVAALFIIVPFLTWYGTWFGRDLSDQDIATYLADEKNPRHIQHALSRVEERIERGDPSAKKFYPQIIALAKSPTGEVRKTAAWVMGQDNKSQEFHQALVSLLTDNYPLVRRNAALQLVRFGDGSGRPELRSMLAAFEVKSPVAGTIVSLLPQGSKISAGGLLARIRDSSNAVQEFRSPVDGAIGRLAMKEGEVVVGGQSIAWLAPDRATVSDALQALAYVGTKEDLPAVESCAQANTSSEIVQQAAAAAKAIKSRAN
ncbi:MAG TPA: HEAT repeat domain-containing protein [Pyrinomonadaceae bacterium]|nr:HEAT repeat domain-containing protein [Pyrinomonadaceae bacterium]